MKILKTIIGWFGIGSKKSSEEISKEPEIDEEPHINIRKYKRAWCYNGEKNDPCLSISLAAKPEDRFLLVEDIEPHFWSVHFCTTSKDALNEEEKNILIRAISERIPDGDYLGSYGFITRGGIHGLDRFLDYGFTRTGEKREIIDKETGKILVIDILQKL